MTTIMHYNHTSKLEDGNSLNLHTIINIIYYTIEITSLHEHIPTFSFLSGDAWGSYCSPGDNTTFKLNIFVINITDKYTIQTENLSFMNYTVII